MDPREKFEAEAAEAEDDLVIEEAEDDEEEGPKSADDVKLDEDERETYSKNVQKRIKQMTFEKYEAARRAEDAERMRDEAVRYAEIQHQRAQQLSTRLEQGEGVLFQEAKARLDAQLEQAKSMMRQAHEAGDTENLVAAQTAVAQLAAQRERVEAMSTMPQTRQPVQQPALQRAPQRPQLPQKAYEWAAENDDWFQKDTRMTNYALAVSEDLIRQGVDPNSDTYYKQVDEEMRKTFPDRFSGGQQADADDDDNGPVVAAPTRTSARKPRKVRLSKAQVALANKLGVSLEDYAKQVMLLKETPNG